MGLRTVMAALQACDLVDHDSLNGPFQISTPEEAPVVCFQFRMSQFTCKAYLAQAAQEEGSQHLKLQTVFEDNRRSLGEEQRYFVANEWNATKRYTRLKCGSGGAGRSSVFTLEYDVLCPAEMPHSWGLLLISRTLRMWYTSMVACVIHIVDPREVPFATHEMITANTAEVAVREEDIGLCRECCPICFECFRPGETVRRLPCMHLFHVVGSDADSEQGRHCNIDRHLVHDKQCPVCKTPIDIMDRIDGSSSNRPGEPKVLSEAAMELLPPAGGSSSSSAQASTDAAQAAGEPGAAAAAGGAARAEVAQPAQASAEADADLGAAPAASEGTPALADPAGRPAPAASAGGPASARAVVAANPGAVAPPAGLPAQAAELERAVRSLQSRWLQIQDVVAGMQQMLHYIEESQTALNAARAQQGGDAAGERAAAEAGGGAEGTQQARPAGEGAAPGPPAAALQPAPAGGAGAAQAAAPAAPPTAAAEAGPRLARQAALSPERPPGPRAGGAVQPHAASGRPAAEAQRVRWQPFSEAEKVCMAHAWRQRCAARAAALEAAAAQLLPPRPPDGPR